MGNINGKSQLPKSYTLIWSVPLSVPLVVKDVPLLYMVGNINGKSQLSKSYTLIWSVPLKSMRQGYGLPHSNNVVALATTLTREIAIWEIASVVA